jgi:hypothetical protein
MNEQDIESEIFETISEMNEEKKEVKERIKGNSRKTKRELIEDYLELQKSQGVETHTEAELKKLTKPEILKLVAEFANKSLEPKLEPKAPRVEEPGVEGELKKESPPELSIDPIAMRFDLIAGGMFNLNMALFSCLETGSFYLKDRTGDVALLEDLTKNSMAKREAFIVVFKQIYRDYKEELDVYLSPVSQYAILTTQVITETIFKNVACKKKNSTEQK